MIASPKTPRAIFWGLGALTIGLRKAGSAMLALEAAGDLEGHQGGWPRQVAPGDDDVDVLELAGGAQILHEVGHRGRGERRARDPEDLVPVFDAGDPEVLRDHVGKGVDERSEEHTSELQSRSDLVCRLL